MKKRVLSVLLVAVMALTMMVGCSNTDDKNTGNGREAKDVKDLVIGELHYSVVEDGGWAQAMHEGMVTACTNLGIDVETQLFTMENIADGDVVMIEAAVEELADKGVDIIFGCSAGYATYFAEIQEDYPDIIFAQQGNDVYDNIVEFQIRGYEGEFLAGYLCALMNEGNNDFGFCGSMAGDASVRTAVNAYALGAKYANPDAKVQVIWADSWYDLDIESNNAKTLIEKGIRYMAMEASSPAVPQTCEENGAYCIGYNIDMEANAPKAVLTSFTWNWAPIFEDIMKKTADGSIEISANYYEGGECAKLADYNDELVPEEIQQKVDELKAKMASGEVTVYGGELKDVDGNVLVEAGQVMADEKILAQDFIVDNVIGGKLD